MLSHDSRIARWLQPLGAGLLDVLYPVRCVGCRGHVPDPALPLCSRCIQRFEHPSADEIRSHLERLTKPPPALGVTAALWVFEQDGALQAIQHALKYGNRPRYGVALGRLMGTAFISDGHPRPDVIVPIPLHRTRHLERGYNQSAMLAEGLGEALDRPVAPEALTRPQPTRSQTTLSRSARWDNVRDAFSAPQPEAIAGRSVLLVDDILTTGSTLAAAAHVLHDAGATSIGFATLAFARD